MENILAYPFMIRGLIVALIFGLLCGILGIFVVMKRLSYIGDTLSHTTFVGIALGTLLSTNVTIMNIVLVCLIAVGITYLINNSELPSDTIIGLFFATSAGLGILILGMLKGFRADLFGYLFGDILAITATDIITMTILFVVIIVLLVAFHKQFLQIIMNKDTAIVSGINVAFYEYLFIIMLAITISISIKLVGIILIVAMLLIPAAAARNISSSLAHLAIYSVIISVISCVGGLIISFYLNTASGASIILVSVLIFWMTYMWSRVFRLNN